MELGKLLQGFGYAAPDAAREATPANSDSADSFLSRRMQILDEFEQTGNGWIWATDKEGNLIYMSQSAIDSLDIDPSNLLGQPMGSLFETDPHDPDARADRPLKFKLGAHSKIEEVVVRFAPGAKLSGAHTHWWRMSGYPLLDKDGKFLGYRGGAKDVTIAYERKLEDSRIAEYDSLTGLANRHRMERKLDSTLKAYKAAKRSCALMMLDLDRFKHVNDTLGHQAGDDLLRQAAQRLREIIGNRGEIGRIGGDEFQIMLPDLDDRGKLGELADKIIQVISQPYPIEDKRALIGTSVGIAVAPYDGLESDELVRASDLALYAAKNGGRNAFRFYSADLRNEAEERELLEKDLRRALEDNILELHYQPVVRTKDDMVVGCEALVRWNDEERGFVSPQSFISVAEESDLILRLGEWALCRACKDATEWPKSVRVAVNVSAVQFADNDFPRMVTCALDESGLEPDRLELELTESVFMGDSERTDSTFKQLKKLGVRIALDDFGTGYSSLSYLRAAPFDKIKVDKSFVDSCTQNDQNSAKIITAIIGLSEALGMETTVEGVEAFDQFDLVVAKGAKLIQGWIYSRALPQDTLLVRMKSGAMKIRPDGPDRHRPERRSVFRRVGVIHEDHRYDAVMRDLSKTGARIEGLMGVPEGTGLVLDLGGGQLAVCVVTRSTETSIAVEFEAALVSDGAGGLCTRYRVSPYALAAAGMPLTSLPPGNYPLNKTVGEPTSTPQFMQVAVAR